MERWADLGHSQATEPHVCCASSLTSASPLQPWRPLEEAGGVQGALVPMSVRVWGHLYFPTFEVVSLASFSL